jgi:hypothetical protein
MLGWSERIVYAYYPEHQHSIVVYIGDREDIDYQKLPDVEYEELKGRQVND